MLRPVVKQNRRTEGERNSGLVARVAKSFDLRSLVKGRLGLARPGIDQVWWMVGEKT